MTYHYSITVRLKKKEKKKKKKRVRALANGLGSTRQCSTASYTDLDYRVEIYLQFKYHRKQTDMNISSIRSTTSPG